MTDRTTNILDFAEVLKQGCVPLRLSILLKLSEGEQCVSDIALSLGVASCSISHHLSGLRAVKLVERRRAGKKTFYSLGDEGKKLADFALSQLSTAQGAQ